jgi:hypothetical protein
MKQPGNRYINAAMTKRIANLHDEGYWSDYSLMPLKLLQCVQDSLPIMTIRSILRY